MRVSARNQLRGTIESIEEGAVTAIVTIGLKGGEHLVSSITLDSVRSLDLKVGDEAYAVIKSSDVMVGIDR
jgi:molybdopterin-binding protein